MFDPHTIQKIAVKAHRDPRTVRAVLDGRGTSTSKGAVHDAMRELGIDPPPPPSEPPSAA